MTNDAAKDTKTPYFKYPLRVIAEQKIAMTYNGVEYLTPQIGQERYFHNNAEVLAYVMQYPVIKS